MIRKQAHKRQIVVCDVDGVVADWFFSSTKVTKKMFGKPEYPQSNYNATSWGFDWLGLTDEHEKQFWDYIHNSTERFWENEREMEPGFISWLYQFWQSRKFVWYWCTTRDDQYSGSAQEQTRNFLKNHCFYDTSVVVSDRKEDFCYAVRADIFIDDSWKNCAKVAAKNPDTTVVWVCLPYQAMHLETAKKIPNVVIIKNIDELKQWLQKNVKVYFETFYDE